MITKTARRSGMSKLVCEKVIDSFIEEIKINLSKEEKIVITGFMTFEIIDRAERRSVDLQTGNPVVYPSVKSIKCKPSKRFRDAVTAKITGE